MSAWAEAVWASNKIENSLSSINSVLDTIDSTINDTNNRVIQLGLAIGNNTYGLPALKDDLDDILDLLNDNDYGLQAIANLAVKKNVVLTTNIGTANAPNPQGVTTSDVVNGALFFIES